VEGATSPTIYANQNFIQNGNLDLDRNRYLYTTDFAGGTGEDGNVSQEAAFFYSHPKDTALESTGSVGAASTALTINDPLFLAGHAGKEIVVEGAGAAGADLVTTINGAPGSTTTATLTVAATTAVTNARVRWNLLQLKEDTTDNNVDANLATNSALKTPTHTRYGSTVNNPDYDKTNGWVRYSDSAFTINCPLSHNLISPSKQYILSFVYKLSGDIASLPTYFADIYVGLWDNSPGQRKFIEGKPLDLTATVVGTPGATSRDYFVVMYTGGGESIGTKVLTVATTNATIDATNYVELSWTQPPNIVRSEIWRKTGATYERLLFPYPASTYKDKGQVNNTGGGFPVVDFKRQRAFVQLLTSTFAPASSKGWRLGQVNIAVPFDYDLSKTTDKQWLIIGLKTSLAGAGSTRALLIDLIALDDKFGTFTRCPLDFFAKRQLSVSPTSGDQGTSGSGDGPIDPGDQGCPAFDALIETDCGQIRAIDLVDNEHKYKVINRNHQAVNYTAKIMPPQVMYTVSAGDLVTTGSETNPHFDDETDVTGKALKEYSKGDSILTKKGVVPIDFIIRRSRKQHTVLITLSGNEKGFWQDEFGVHNLKTFRLD
jgi:hypothetical protein